MDTLISYINVLEIFCLFLGATAILVKEKASPSKWRILFFIYCSLTYLLLDFTSPGLVRRILISGPFLLPFSFWILVDALFSDKPLRLSSFWIAGVLLLCLNYSLFYFKINDASMYSRVLAVLFVIMAIFKVQQKRRTDLVEERRNLRALFTYSIGILVFLTLLSRSGLIFGRENDVPKLVQRSAILLFTSYFLIVNASIRDVFLGKYEKKTSIRNPELVDKIQRIMKTERIYRKEALTIRLLAEIIEEQEYKVRQAINQELGYRNFTDFINSYRIQEAKEFLSDARNQNMTVLEVAYKVGFNSIRPFNRAFKQATNKTPTEFRRSL